MRRIISLIITLAAVTSAVSAAIPAAQVHIVDSLRAELGRARTPADSLPALCNLYDILPREESTPLGTRLINTAMNAGDQTTALSIIRNQADRQMRSDSALRALTERAMMCDDSNDRKETLTLIRLIDNMRSIRFSDRDDRERTLKSYLKMISDSEEDDLYDRIAITHGICLLLSDGSGGDVLVSFMDSLGSLVRRLPSTAFSLRNVYNTHAASIFASTHPEKSMAADLHALADLDKLERYHHENGRIYNNHNSKYYTIYTRLLSNYDSLDSAKVEEYYHKVLDLLPTDQSIQEAFNISPMAEVYHAMFHKDYRRALPPLRKAIDNPLLRNRRTRHLRLEMECAEALGDKATLLEATRAYADALNEELADRSRSSYRELQVAYAIYDIQSNIGIMEAERREAVASMQRTVIIVSSCALVLLLVLAGFLFRLYRKNHKLAHSLYKSNLQLKEESENLRQSRADLIRTRDMAMKANNLKSDFIKNMSYEVKIPLQAITEYSRLIADCVSDAPSGEACTSGRHLARFADMVELNSELLSTIIDDVLRLSEIESSSLPIQAQVVNLRNLAEATLTGVQHRVKPGVRLMVDPACGRLDLFTDPTRLQQILNNLLTNAAKFTTDGAITIAYAPTDDGNNVRITVTDTGIGINPENKEKIFERFVKLDRDTQGAGLGLTISRLLARHLGGDLTLDTSYTSGARFVLTIPKK